MSTLVRSRADSAWKWLYTAWALVAVKLAVTALWSLQRHHAAPRLPHLWQEVLFWITKVTPPLFCAALIVWARESGNRRLMYFFAILLVLVIPFDIVVVYAMYHGWKGWQI